MSEPMLVTDDSMYYVHGESYDQLKTRYLKALDDGDKTFEIRSGIQAFQGAVPVLVPIERIKRIEFR